jgi:hypothetical protein
MNRSIKLSMQPESDEKSLWFFIRWQITIAIIALIIGLVLIARINQIAFNLI